MAQLDTGGGGGGKHGKQRAKKASTHIDMTPMVDLAFLLLTFFILTSTFSKPKTMEITMPDDKDTSKTKVKNVLTFILSEKDKVYYYKGVLQDNPELSETNFSKDGLRKILQKENQPVIKKIAELGKKLLEDKSLTNTKRDSLFNAQSSPYKADKNAVTVIIKADDKAKYRNVVDMIDEMGINDIDKYAIVTQFLPLETKLLSEKK